MKSNKLKIIINKSVDKVFQFTITPPNSTLWISGIIKEETNDFPIHIGTIYKLENNKGNIYKVVVSNLSINRLIEWTSSNNNYHCRYSYKAINNNITELEYYE